MHAIVFMLCFNYMLLIVGQKLLKACVVLLLTCRLKINIYLSIYLSKLYLELSSLEEGLVMGPVDNWILQYIYTVAWIGTVLLVVEMGLRLHHLLTGSIYQLININIVEACVVFFEDIPQLVIGIILLVCRGEAKSLFPFLRAIVTFIGSIATLCCACCKDMKQREYTATVKEKKKNPNLIKRGLLNFGLRCNAFRIFGVIIVFFLALFSFTFTFVDDETRKYLLNRDTNPGNKNGTLAYDSIPHRAKWDFSGLLDSEENNERFFSNVGIYGDASGFQVPFQQAGNMTWIKFFDINEIRSFGEITTRITIDTSLLRIQNFYTSSRVQRNATNACYRLVGTDDIMVIKETSCAQLNGTRFHFHFKYLPPSKRHLLGDIEYNFRKTPTGVCENIALSPLPNLRYFHANSSDNVQGHLHGPMWNYKFYNVETDLIDINDVWRTGAIEEDGLFGSLKRNYQCDNTGSVSPHYNPDIPVPCPP